MPPSGKLLLFGLYGAGAMDTSPRAPRSVSNPSMLVLAAEQDAVLY